MSNRPHRVVLATFPETQILDVTGPLEVFARTSRWLTDNRRRATPAYAIELVAESLRPIRSSSGLRLVPDRTIGTTRGTIDTLMVAGGIGVTPALERGRIVDWLRHQAPRAGRVASVCTGAFLLAEAGLLDGKRATTHWRSCEKLAKQYPRVNVEADPIFVRDGRVWTSAGVTAGMDLALALVEEDFGAEIALAVARELVVYLRRPGGQSQFSAQLAVQAADREPIRELLAWITENAGEDLSVPTLAAEVGMSPRNFARVFAREVGVTPARYVERARLEAARRRLEESDDGVDEISAACGFGSAEILRRSFLRVLRVTPSAYRGRFRSRLSA